MRGRGKGAKETLARKPHDFEKRFLFSPPPPPSIFFCSRYNYTLQLYRVHDVFQREVSVQFGGDCAYWKRLLRRLFPFPSERLPRRLRRYCLTFTCKEFLIFNFHMLKHCIQGARLLSSHPRLFVHSFIHFNPKTKDANPYSFLAN